MMNQQTNYPKIGILPIIDGLLDGVRGSLDDCISFLTKQKFPG